MQKLIFAFMAVSALSISVAEATDFSTTINNLDGTPMVKADKAPLTLEEVASTALLSSYPDEQNLEGVEKNKRFWLAKKIHDHPKDPVLTADEIALIKRLISKAYNPLVVGQSWTILDPASVPK